MDDLSGLTWSSLSKSSPKATTVNPSPISSYPPLRPSHSPFTSGRNTPLSVQGSGNSLPKPPGVKAPVQDSFSGLLSFPQSKPTANLSLREQQERLEAEKRRKEEERRKQTESHFGNGQFLDSLGSRGTSRTTSPAIPPPPVGGSMRNGANADDDDLFAGFRADTKVDNSSHYPPPPQAISTFETVPPTAKNTSISDPMILQSNMNQGGFGDDDDPFGLSQLTAKSNALPTAAYEEDDVLGDLGRPVEEIRRKKPVHQALEPGKPIEVSDTDSSDDPNATKDDLDPFDKAVAQLVDYGFTPENARRGLTESGAGLNVQAAVNWLLDDAHRQSKEKAKGRDPSANRRRGRGDGGNTDAEGPAWSGGGGRSESPYRREGRLQADSDLSKTAAAVGSNLLKTANSIWKTSQKKVQKAVAEFQQDGDQNQPKWMRSAHPGRPGAPEKRPDVTDEALMLESGMRPGASMTGRSQPHSSASRDQSPAQSARSSGRSTPLPKWQQSLPAQDPRTRLSKVALEDDDVSSYISPNRRRRATPEPQRPPVAAPDRTEENAEALLLGTTTAGGDATARRSVKPSVQANRPTAVSTATRQTRPVRHIPSITPIALRSSSQHRLAGTAHFKRGDYAAAHASYTSSLSNIPPSHPLTIILLTNRALTSLKNGEPKQAIDDANEAIKVIGPSRGQGETVSVAGETGVEEKRDMKDLYGKALSRKAEALEQMERWAEAGSVWQACVEANVGGATAIAGRQRCQKALTPKPVSAPRPTANPKPKPRSSALANLGQQKDSEAVERLRAANQAAAKEDDEKFALADQVDARISAWRDGKRENLRALLGCLEQVLWEGSGWKKVGLHELVVPNKVKIVYMKAIAKTHPDKLPQDASTEVRLVAATVFATLNESWDKFKAENGL